MGGACSLGLKKIQNPVQKHQAHGLEQYHAAHLVYQNQGSIQNKDIIKYQQLYPNQASQVIKEKNSNYNDSYKNQQFHPTNPFSTEYNGGGEIGDQIYEYERTYQIGRYFLENNLTIQANKGKSKWQQFLADGQKRLIKMDEKIKAQIFTKENQSFIVNYAEKNLAGNIYSGKESQLSEFIEKGQVPQQDRWSAWKIKLNVQKYYVKGKYERLLRKKCVCEKDIKKDIGRAYPDEEFFKIDDNLKYHQKQRRINQTQFKGHTKQFQKQNDQNYKEGSKQNKYGSQEDKQNSPDKYQNDKENIFQFNQNSQIHKDKNYGTKQLIKNHSIFKKESKSKEDDDQNFKQQQNLKDKIQTNNMNPSKQQNDFIKFQVDQLPENEEDPNGFLKQMSNQMKLNSKKVHLQQKFNNNFEKKSIDLYEEEPYMKMKSIGQQSLLNVLNAISNYFPNFRYTQGMNMVVGFFLLVNGGIEEEAFWMFVCLARSEKYLIMGLYEDCFPLIDLTQYIFDEKFKEYLPDLHYHIRQNLEVNYYEWYFKWVLTIFLDKFCLQQAIRFWDFIISSDSFFSIIQISLALLQELEQNIIGEDQGQFHSLFNGFKDEYLFLWDKAHPQYIDIEKVLQNAKKIKLTTKHIANLASSYPTSISNIIQNKESQINEKSKEKQKMIQDTLNQQILIRIQADEQSPNVLSDNEDNKLADQVKDLKKQSSYYSKLQNQFNKNDDFQKELSERQVIQQPQIDYMSSDIDYKLPKIKASPEKSQIGMVNTNRSFLPPIKQKKKDKDGQQINIPDESNEPAKNKLKTIINPNKSPDEKLYEFNIDQGEIQQVKMNLNMNDIDSIESNHTPQMKDYVQPLSLIKPIRAYSKRHQSSSDIHVMSLDQLEINQQYTQRNNNDDSQDQQKKHLPFLNYIKNQTDIIGGNSTPSSKYYFNSPNKIKKKIQRSNSQNIKDSVKIKRNNNYLKSVIKNDKNNQQIMKQISQNNQNQEDFSQTLQIMEHKDEQIRSSNNIVHLSEIQKYNSKLPSINLNSEKKPKNQSQNSMIIFDQEQNKDNDFDENDHYKQYSSSQTQIHQNQDEDDDDFNIEQNNNPKKSLSHQTTNSIHNVANILQQSSQNQNFENLESRLQNLKLKKNSVYSSRPSSHCSSNEYYDRQKKQQLQSQNTPQKNLSTFSTPKTKEKQLQNISFQKSVQVVSNFYSQKQTEINNQSEKFTQKNRQIDDKTQVFRSSETNILQSQSNTFISVRNKNKIKKFRPSSNIQKNSIYNPSLKLNSMGNMEDIYKDDDSSKSFIEQEKIYQTPTKVSNREEKINNEDTFSINQEDNIKENNHSYPQINQNSLEKSEGNKESLEGDFNNQGTERKQSILYYQNESSDEELELKDQKQSSKVQSKQSGHKIEQLQQQEGLYQTNDISQQNMRQIQQNYEQQKNSDKYKNQFEDQLNSLTLIETKRSPNFNENAFNQILKQQSNNFDDHPIQKNQKIFFQSQFTLDPDAKENFQKQPFIPSQSENQKQSENKENEKPLYNSMRNSIIEQQKNNQNPYESINDKFQTDFKKEDQFHSQNAQNSHYQADENMSEYINELPQHNISGYSIQLQNTSHGHVFQNNFQNSQNQNQAKTFSINQIPSPTNSRIDDARSQISEISNGNYNQNQQDQQNQQDFLNIPKSQQSNQDNKNKHSFNQNTQKINFSQMMDGESQIKHSQGTLETFRDYDTQQTEEQQGVHSNNSNKVLADTNLKINSQQQQQQQNDYVSKLLIKNFSNNNPNSQHMLNTHKNDNQLKVLQTEAPSISLNTSEQPAQRNYAKSNSLVLLGSTVTQNIFHNLQNSPSQSITNSNLMKYKNNLQTNSASFSTPQQFPYQNAGILSGGDKVNNYVTYSNPYQMNSNSVYHLQEIQEENYREYAYEKLKSKKHQGKETTPFQIYGETHKLDQQYNLDQNYLNDSIISSKSNQTYRSKLSLTNQQQQFDLENQNDILDEFSHSHIHSNNSVSKIQQSQSKIHQNKRKPSIIKNISLSQLHQDHTHLGIISSAAQKNLVQGSQNSIGENTLNTSNQQIQQKKYQNKIPLSQSPIQNQNQFNRSFNEIKNSSKKSSQQSLKILKD